MGVQSEVPLRVTAASILKEKRQGQGINVSMFSLQSAPGESGCLGDSFAQPVTRKGSQPGVAGRCVRPHTYLGRCQWHSFEGTLRALRLAAPLYKIGLVLYGGAPAAGHSTSRRPPRGLLAVVRRTAAYQGIRPRALGGWMGGDREAGPGTLIAMGLAPAL